MYTSSKNNVKYLKITSINIIIYLIFDNKITNYFYDDI